MGNIYCRETRLYCVARPEEGAFLEYRLFNSDGCYGIEIVKKNGDTLFERKAVSSVCADLEQAKELLELLFKNTVTPISLQYVLEDWVDCQSFVCKS